MRGRFVAVRGWRVTSSGRRRAGWLIGEDASDGKRRYDGSNFGPAVALEWMVEYAHRRRWVEHYHEEAKGLLGWDQYQGRLGGGIHRHESSMRAGGGGYRYVFIFGRIVRRCSMCGFSQI